MAVEVEAVRNQLSTGEAPGRNAALAMRVQIASDMPDFVCKHAGHGSSQKLVAFAELAAVHGGTSGYLQFVAEYLGEGKHIPVSRVSESKRAALVKRQRDGLYATSAAEADQDEIGAIDAELDFGAEFPFEAALALREEPIKFGLKFLEGRRWNGLLAFDDDD